MDKILSKPQSILEMYKTDSQKVYERKPEHSKIDKRVLIER